jgi:hypothetical protein
MRLLSEPGLVLPFAARGAFKHITPLSLPMASKGSKDESPTNEACNLTKDRKKTAHSDPLSVTPTFEHPSLRKMSGL